jgi:hypothetical protein
MPVDIPSGLTLGHAQSIGDILQKIFVDLKNAGADVGRVNSRLNCSNTDEAIPVWVGTCEAPDIERDQGFRAAEVRFGRVNRSKVYEETITDGKWQIHDRDWRKGWPEKQKDGYGPGQALGPTAGCMDQLYIAIRVKEDGRYQHVGTITVSFKNKPDRKKVDDIIKHWADHGSDYASYLKGAFNLGGPVC